VVTILTELGEQFCLDFKYEWSLGNGLEIRELRDAAGKENNGIHEELVSVSRAGHLRGG
jgi:hypothetical protein